MKVGIDSLSVNGSDCFIQSEDQSDREGRLDDPDLDFPLAGGGAELRVIAPGAAWSPFLSPTASRTTLQSYPCSMQPPDHDPEAALPPTL